MHRLFTATSESCWVTHEEISHRHTKGSRENAITDPLPLLQSLMYSDVEGMTTITVYYGLWDWNRNSCGDYLCKETRGCVWFTFHLQFTCLAMQKHWLCVHPLEEKVDGFWVLSWLKSKGLSLTWPVLVGESPQCTSLGWGRGREGGGRERKACFRFTPPRKGWLCPFRRQ